MNWYIRCSQLVLLGSSPSSNVPVQSSQSLRSSNTPPTPKSHNIKMRSTSFVAVALCTFASTVYSAPAPQLGLSNIVGSVTNPGAGNDNKFEGIGNGNGVSFLLHISLQTSPNKAIRTRMATTTPPETTTATTTRPATATLLAPAIPLPSLPSRVSA
jgi:hypothetical protein